MGFFHCQIWFQSRVGRCEASEWTRKVGSIFSHFVRRDTSHLSEAVSGFFGRCDYRILDNETSNFFSQFFYLTRARGTYQNGIRCHFGHHFRWRASNSLKTRLLNVRLFYQFRLNPTTAPLTKLFGWLPVCWIGALH